VCGMMDWLLLLAFGAGLALLGWSVLRGGGA
jgi:hypothetical protein